MEFSDRGFTVWRKLLPPVITMTVAAGGIVACAAFGLQSSWPSWLFATAIAAAALRLVYIGLAQWQLPSD